MPYLQTGARSGQVWCYGQVGMLKGVDHHILSASVACGGWPVLQMPAITWKPHLCENEDEEVFCECETAHRRRVLRREGVTTVLHGGLW